jgi:hypothetical protein
MGKENRLIPRTRKRIRVTVGTSPAFTVDISPGGFCIETMATQRPGTDIAGKIRVDDQEFPFTGKIAWARAGDLRLNQRGRMGVRITGISDGYFKLFG